MTRQTVEQLDRFRELRSWLREDLGERSGLRISPAGVGDYVRLDRGWVHRDRRQESFSEARVSEALGLPPERIQRYLDTAQSLELRFAIQLPGDSGYASLRESLTGAWSGCVGLLRWGVEPKPEWVHLEADWYLEWACE